LVPEVKKRLVIYLGCDGRSAEVLRKVKLIRDLFDEVRTIYVPESDPEVLDDLSIPSVMVEEVAT